MPLCPRRFNPIFSSEFFLFFHFDFINNKFVFDKYYFCFNNGKNNIFLIIQSLFFLIFPFAIYRTDGANGASHQNTANGTSHRVNII